VPSFEDALLPEALRSWVADVAARVQCPAVCRFESAPQRRRVTDRQFTAREVYRNDL
jgi:hypothetical protein